VTFLLLALGAQVLAAFTAILLARRRAEHRPAAVALAALAIGNILDTFVLLGLTPYPVEPWEGSARLLVYLDGALNLANYAVIAGLAVAVAATPEQRRRAAAVVAGVWLLASVVLAALYPSPLVRGANLQRVYLASDLIGLFVSIVALVGWARRGIAAKRSPGSVHVVALGLVILDAAILIAPLSPWRGSVFGASFDATQLIITVSFAALAAVQVILWRSTRSASS
jgi:hypothetical protein